MNKPIRNIISFSIILLFYLSAIIEKLYGTVRYDIDSLFGQYIFITLIGLGAIYLLNRYLLKNELKAFIRDKGNVLVDIGFTILLISCFLVFNGLERVIRDLGGLAEVDRDEIYNALEKVFSNNNYALFFFGPFLWLSEGFMILSRIFILNNLWELKNNRTWNWITLLIISVVCALLQINHGFLTVFITFLMFSSTHIVYLRYRRVLPLIYASIIYQTIDIIALWIHVL